MRRAIGAASRLIAACAAAALAYLSFTSNADFWRHTFDGREDMARFYVALSLTAGAIKIMVPVYAEVYAIKLRAHRPFMAVFAVALVFDLLSGIGYASLSRAEIGGDAAKIAETRAALTGQIEAARDRLKRLPPASRSVAAIRAERDRQNALGRCDGRKSAATDRCARLADLEAALGDAEARAAVELRLNDLESQLLALPAPRDADPQATALAGALNIFLGLIPGAPLVSPDVAKWALAGLLVLLIELGPITCARMTVAPFTVPEPPAPPAPRLPKITPAPVPANQQAGGLVWQPCEPKPRPEPKPRGDLLETLRDAAAGGPCPPWINREGEWLFLAQGAAAAALGVSKPTIGRRLRTAQAAGLIEMAATNAGTAIKFFPLKSVAAA